MKLSELLEILNYFDEETSNDPEVEVYMQPHYPLKARIENVRRLDGTIAIALSESNDYGTTRAWADDEDEEDE